MHLTTKQIDFLNTVGRRNPDGGALDLDQLIERLMHKPSKQSVQFSIRALIAHGLIQKDAPEKRRGRTRTIISLTKAGEMMIGKPKAPIVETIPDELLDELSDVFESQAE
jgi:DNA-binding MarR family transcriptional regulator